VVRFRNGVDSYVNVITAENAFLTAREAELQVKLRQLTSSVGLINDLGGGWSVSQLGETERMAAHPPDAGQEPKIPAGEAGSAANPPSMPAAEIQPDDFLKLNDEAPPPPPRGTNP
jgi:outer membrane protein, multidrug efflux system